MAGISDADKNSLALDTRRMFDPAAKVEQVTQKDRDLLTKEAGIERSDLHGQLLLGKAGKGGAPTFSQFAIADKPCYAASGRDLERDRCTAWLRRQNVPAQLLQQIGRSAGPRMAISTDRAQFGNTRGLSQQAVSVADQQGHKVSFSSLDVAGSADAVQAAVGAGAQG